MGGRPLSKPVEIIFIRLTHTEKNILIVDEAFLGRNSLYEALVALEFSMETRLALSSQKSSCLCLKSAEIKDMRQHSAVLGFVVEWGGVSLCSPGWLAVSILLPLLLNADLTG